MDEKPGKLLERTNQLRWPLVQGSDLLTDKGCFETFQHSGLGHLAIRDPKTDRIFIFTLFDALDLARKRGLTADSPDFDKP